MALNLVGQRFGRLTVLERIETPPWLTHEGSRWYKVRCDCGNVFDVRGNSLRQGVTRSCGCLRAEKTAIMRAEKLARIPSLVGQRFGRLTVLEKIEPLDPVVKKMTRYRCRCDCGNIKDVNACHLKSGGTKSCGCLHVENGTRNLQAYHAQKRKNKED